MRRATAHGIADNWLIYNPLHAVLEKNGPERAAAIVARLEALARTSGLPPPVWSIADEPSNPDQAPGELETWTKALRKHSPSSRLAGHLNTPGDQKFVPLFDTLIINPSFGIDTQNVSKLNNTGKNIWYYNTFRPRFTAGIWLWNTAASKYVQWHARMPTADPFDPIDGREADFQVLYPMREICAKTPDIHRDLLRMAEGITDQRWLLWLETRKTPSAQKLVAELRRKYSGSFPELAKATRTELEGELERVKGLAQSPN